MTLTQKIQLVVSFLFLFLAGTIHQEYKKPFHKVTKQQLAVNLKDSFLLTVNLGMKRLISSVLWIKTLIDSDEEHYTKNDLNDWMYLRFTTMIKLDPKFKEVYSMGGQYLSIIKDDDAGAKDIFDKGLSIYPKDYFINYNALYHYYFELKDREYALQIFKNIDHDPRVPFYVRSMMSKAAIEGDDPELALRLLEQAKTLTTNEIILQKLEERIQKIKKGEP
ncbi:MAG: hypothetical protein JNM93_10325 [Bacteriovoracaceae bacterium]|nr:hypothetical protein [Bacteriovoracaceae bacterium]